MRIDRSQVQQSSETNHNVETQCQDHVIARVAIARQASIRAKSEQEWIDKWVKQHKGDQHDQVKTLRAATAQGQVVGHQVLCLFANARRGKYLQLRSPARGVPGAIRTISPFPFSLSLRGPRSANNPAQPP